MRRGSRPNSGQADARQAESVRLSRKRRASVRSDAPQAEAGAAEAAGALEDQESDELLLEEDESDDEPEDAVEGAALPALLVERESVA